MKLIGEANGLRVVSCPRVRCNVTGVQTPPEQKSPATQSASAAQLPRQAVAPQTYGLQTCVWRAGQLPALSQPARSIATPALQLAPRQVVPAPGYAQAV